MAHRKPEDTARTAPWNLWLPLLHRTLRPARWDARRMQVERQQCERAAATHGARGSLALPVCIPLVSAIAPLDCMNRNARKPSPANHGARPNSSYNRKRASPEFGSWRHAGLRPGQTPAPRPQPGTPACVAEVAVLGAATPSAKPAAPAAAAPAESKGKKAAAATPQ